MTESLKKIEIRPYWQMALAGLIIAALMEIPLAACRGVGLIDWTPELIPGRLLGQFLGGFSNAENWGLYGLSGAVAGIIYRFGFDSIGGSGWDVGMSFGVIQWAFIGVLVGALEPFLPMSPLLLPSEAPDQTAYGVTCFLIIFLINTFFGTCMGILGTREREIALSEQPPSEQASSPLERAA